MLYDSKIILIEIVAKHEQSQNKNSFGKISTFYELAVTI